MPAGSEAGRKLYHAFGGHRRRGRPYVDAGYGRTSSLFVQRPASGGAPHDTWVFKFHRPDSLLARQSCALDHFWSDAPG